MALRIGNIQNDLLTNQSHVTFHDPDTSVVVAVSFKSPEGATKDSIKAMAHDALTAAIDTFK